MRTARQTLIEYAAPQVAATAKLGDSIAVNGCCLTGGRRRERRSLPSKPARKRSGEPTWANCKRAARSIWNASLAVGERLGGHFVTGHVDAVGTVVGREQEGDWTTIWFCFPAELGRQLASKGSVAVDGVSLTLVDVEPERFSVQLIPHTLAVTTLGRRAVGDRVNLETDLLAKYVQKLLANDA